MHKGQRVELHPATDAWMQGDRFGVVVGFGRQRVATCQHCDGSGEEPGGAIDLEAGIPLCEECNGHGTVKAVRVKLDKSGRVRRFHPDNVTPLADTWECPACGADICGGITLPCPECGTKAPK